MQVDFTVVAGVVAGLAAALGALYRRQSRLEALLIKCVSGQKLSADDLRDLGKLV